MDYFNGIQVGGCRIPSIKKYRYLEFRQASKEFSLRRVHERSTKGSTGRRQRKGFENRGDPTQVHDVTRPRPIASMIFLISTIFKFQLSKGTQKVILYQVFRVENDNLLISWTRYCMVPQTFHIPSCKSHLITYISISKQKYIRRSSIVHFS